MCKRRLRAVHTWPPLLALPGCPCHPVSCGASHSATACPQLLTQGTAHLRQQQPRERGAGTARSEALTDAGVARQRPDLRLVVVRQLGGHVGSFSVRAAMDDAPLTCTPETDLDEVRRMMLASMRATCR